MSLTDISDRVNSCRDCLRFLPCSYRSKKRPEAAACCRQVSDPASADLFAETGFGFADS